LRDPAPASDALDEPGELERRRLTLAEERDRALGALKELEFDHRTGKISDDDYRSLVGPLRRRAAAALRALEPRAEARHARVAREHAKRLAEVQGLRGRRAVIESERRSALLRLGEATRSGDEEAVAAARTRLDELEQAEKALHGRLEERRTLTDERIRRVRMS